MNIFAGTHKLFSGGQAKTSAAHIGTSSNLNICCFFRIYLFSIGKMFTMKGTDKNVLELNVMYSIKY